MWSRSDSAYAQHWWPQGSQEKAGGERGKFEASLRSSGLNKYPQQPCYPEVYVGVHMKRISLAGMELRNRMKTRHYNPKIITLC